MRPSHIDVHHIAFFGNGIGNLTGKGSVRTRSRTLNVLGKHLLLCIFQEMLQTLHTTGFRAS